MNLETERLLLVNCDLASLEAILKGDAALAKHLKVKVPKRWTEFGAPIFRWSIERLREHPGEQAWLTYLPIIKAEKMLAGSCGFKGAPDENGSVEIGYEIAYPFREKGYATEAATALVRFAFSRPEVKKVIAHTLPEPNASTHVLTKVGMKMTQELSHPQDGKVWRWEIDKVSWQKKK